MIFLLTLIFKWENNDFNVFCNKRTLYFGMNLFKLTWIKPKIAGISLRIAFRTENVIFNTIFNKNERKKKKKYYVASDVVIKRYQWFTV